jgi:tetratricopeptide (TPR) repeat protein
MQANPEPTADPARREHLPILLAASLLVLAVVAAYVNSFAGAMVYDDRTAITENESIRTLWPLTRALSPPATAGTGGRPLANLSLAVDYAISGTRPWSYHLQNLAIHTLGALVLFGLVRRSLQLPALRGHFGRAALPVALATAAWWALHPVQTQSVTYLSQRTEELMGLCYLLTLYCFVRGIEGQLGRWHVLTVAACFLGLLSKEVMVTAPLLVLLYDRTFVAGNFRAALAQRGRLYVALGATWLVLPFLMRDLATRSVGLDAGVSWFDYALTQCRAVVTYLKLAAWPHPLIFDRGAEMTRTISEVLGPAVLLFVAVAGTLVALAWRPILGFVGCWFFVILAPTSSVVPVAEQPIAENRMYLPLVATAMLAVWAIRTVTGRRSRWIWAVGAVALGLLTVQRNKVYRSELTLWQDTVAKNPLNARAHFNLGLGFEKSGDLHAAVSEYRIALRLRPTHAKAHNNLGSVLLTQGEVAAAAESFQRAIGLWPDMFEAQFNLGLAHAQLSNATAAIGAFEAALRLKPDLTDARVRLAQELLRTHRARDAAGHFQQAAQSDPRHFDAAFGLACALFVLGEMPAAAAQFEQSLRIRPDSPEAHNNLGNVLLQLGRLPDAIGHFDSALRLRRDYAEARYNLGLALLRSDRLAEARGALEQALALSPDEATIHHHLGTTLAKLGQLAEAAARFEHAVKLDPQLAEARANLSAIRAQIAADPAPK